MELRLAGTRALVTGAGSDGIGRAAAIALARAGAVRAATVPPTSAVGSAFLRF